jgi:hypothetical protein
LRAQLDTHVAIWLVMGAKKRLRGVERSLRRAALFVSPVVVAEMEFLREIGRINEPVEKISSMRVQAAATSSTWANTSKKPSPPPPQQTSSSYPAELAFASAARRRSSLGSSCSGGTAAPPR